MKDKEFLEWIRGRLHFQHGENLNVDYMRRFQSIIDSNNEEVLKVKFEGSQERCNLLFTAKNHWADRARAAEKEIEEIKEFLYSYGYKGSSVLKLVENVLLEDK